MNINRLRPTGVKREDLDVWLSGVIHDACRDAQEAGMPQREVHQLLKTITDMHHPFPRRVSPSCKHEWSVDEQGVRRCIGCGEPGP